MQSIKDLTASNSLFTFTELKEIYSLVKLNDF